MSTNAEYAITKLKIDEARTAVNKLDNSREKSLVLTKLEEAGHWLEADRLRAHYAAGGV